MKNVVLLISLVLLLSACAEVQTPAITELPPGVTWKPAPPSLLPGAQFALLEGNTSKAEPFTFRLKLPVGYELHPHTHPAIEHVTVLSGLLLFHIGSGDFDATDTIELPAGSFLAIPKGTQMFGIAREETILQVHGVGPWGIEYTHSEDDPRKK